jgi:hypothetical protein
MSMALVARWWVAMPLLFGLAHVATAKEPTVWQVLADGHELLDAQTGLIWSRCLEGAQWNGRHCEGSPRLLTHAEAIKHAQQRQPVGQWRLPRVPELQRALLKAPSVKVNGEPAFPDVPGVWLWTGTAHVDGRPVNPYDYGNVQRGLTPDNAVQMNFLHGWAVHEPDGKAEGKVLKRQRLALRLVRPAR